MAGRPPAARNLTVRRGYEFARLQKQLLSLAYEQLLPIVRSQPGPAATSHQTRFTTTTAAR
jgi:hypothetical protein